MTWPALLLSGLAVVLALCMGVLIGVVLAAMGQHAERAKAAEAGKADALRDGMRAWEQRIRTSADRTSTTWSQ